MKIIQVVGLANSGKTSFIKLLIPALSLKGNVAVIKHLGDHEFFLEENKDTTDFFNSGAQVSIGIDDAKSVIAIRKNSLDDIILFLSQQKIDFVIIEGFKKRSFPKIVIGDLAIEKSVLINPTIDEVIDSLSLFEDFNSRGDSTE
jgi:molybdopterin-guanine dinucleotide biosynthesis protein MobB